MTQHTDVAGPSGYGPKVTVRRSCSDCKACNSESYAVQGDSGHYVYCEHPSLPESKYIGDTNWNTPHWCPVSAPTTQPAPQQKAQKPMAWHEHARAIREGNEIAASDKYFSARPQIVSADRRKVFQAGFERGWDAARAAQEGKSHDN